MSDLAFVRHDIDGVAVEQFTGDGYINLNQLADVVGKRIDNWLANQSTKDLLNEFDRQNKLPGNRGSVEVKAIVTIEGRNGGTWAHPDIAIQFAQWCSPVVALKVSRIVRDWCGTKYKANSHKFETITQLVDNICAKYDNPCFRHDLAKLRIASAGNVSIAGMRQAVLNGEHVPETYVNQESHFCSFAFDIDLAPSIGESIRLDVLWANLVQWYANKGVIKISTGRSVVKLRKKILMADDAPSVYRGGQLFDTKQKLMTWLNFNGFQFRAVMLDDDMKEWVSNGWTINDPLELNYDVIGWELAYEL